MKATVKHELRVAWRWKTKGWTQPWLGWNDVKAGKDS